MEALWNLEDKLKISTQGAAILLACTAALTVGVCAFATILKQRSKVVDREVDENQSEISSGKDSDKLRCNLGFVAKSGLMESVQWSIARKWDHGNQQNGKWFSWRTLQSWSRGGCGGRGRWRSRDSAAAAVWQRPILMGERCELPRFSGLILYDERGRPLPHSSGAVNCREKPQDL